MANAFERLFASKRKASVSPVVDEVESHSEPQFPSPSFIRPKASRMAAREEKSLRNSGSRSPSVPDIVLSQRIKPARSQNWGSITGSSREHSLTRSSSSGRPKPEFLITSLQEFQFPRLPTPTGEISPLSMTFSNKSSEAHQPPSPRSCSPLRLTIPLQRVHTPPSSDPEDSGSDCLPSLVSRNKRLPRLPYGAPPTPGDSPELGPVLDSQLTTSKPVEILDQVLFRDIQRQLGEVFDPFHPSSLRRSFSQSSLAPSTPRLSFSSSTLREPDVNEFLNLSDDDIAECHIESPQMKPLQDLQPSLPPMDLSISSSQPLPSSLLTLTPPRASKPAAAAAFEAARIAKRYDFDLVYVVNLWPDSSRPPTASSRLEGDGPKTLQTPLIGRLLAAHGLHHVPSPLQIASQVHSTILRSNGWVEYRNEDAESHDLARGYASAFYSGQYSRSCQEPTTTHVSGVRLSDTVDRGIVFAAYRKPRAGGNKLGRSFNQEELGDLHRDAEVLVEMLIDIHHATRERQPPTPTEVADDTGPIPKQGLNLA